MIISLGTDELRGSEWDSESGEAQKRGEKRTKNGGHYIMINNISF